MKICNKCQEEKDISFFSLSKGKPIARCKSCIKEYQRNRFIQIKSDESLYSKRLKDGRDLYHKYVDKQRLRKKEYTQKNIEKIKDKRKIRARERIKNNISRRIRHLISKNNVSFIAFVNFDKTSLKEHLEALFDPWMTWDNYGKYNKTWDDNDQSTWTWQIDHIIPQSDLPYTSMEDENFKKCWALDNLRPYSSKQNLLDGLSKVRHKKESK